MLKCVIQSGPLVNFAFAMDDVVRLISLHDGETMKPRGRRPRQVEVYKRAAIILSITAWETFVEDTIASVARNRIKSATTPDDIRGTFNSVAHAWLESEPRPKPPELKAWAGDGWKNIALSRLEADLAALNTPNTGNVRALSKRYLDSDLTKSWAWQATSAERAQKRLDDLIKLRGGLVHRGPQFFKNASIKRKHVVDGIALLRKLVERTEETLGVGPRIVGRAGKG